MTWFRGCALKYILVIFAGIILVTCRDKPERSQAGNRPGDKEMADLNTYLIRKDRERIQNYIERKNLRMTESSTGLWYQITKDGEGANFNDNDKILLDYECTLLDGAKCYSSAELGPKEIILGRSNIEAGLNEGLRMMKSGSEAIFIIPPFLGYGLIGDQNAIPPRAVIVYTVKAR